MSPMWRQGKRQKPKNQVLESVVFSWFARTGFYVTHVEAREEAKTKKPRFRKCGFFVVCPYGTHVEAREGAKTKKTRFSGFFVVAHTGPYVTHVEAREEAKTKKPRFRKCGFFVVCPYGPLCHPCEGKGRRQKRKKHVLESVVFSWFARTGPYVTHVEAREEAKTKKPRF